MYVQNEFKLLMLFFVVVVDDDVVLLMLLFIKHLSTCLGPHVNLKPFSLTIN